MTTETTLLVEERLRRLFQHLGIDRAHVAGRLPSDWRGLATAFPEMVASLTLLGPTTVDPQNIAHLDGGHNAADDRVEMSQSQGRLIPGRLTEVLVSQVQKIEGEVGDAVGQGRAPKKCGDPKRPPAIKFGALTS